MTNAKAKFADRQDSVTVHEIGNTAYVEICLNETIVQEEAVAGESFRDTYYVYDYSEFTFPIGTLNVEEIKTNPADYLTFKYNGKSIEDMKAEKIAESRLVLNEYLSCNPLFSSAKYKDGKYYNVTAEKQQHLTAKIMMATMCLQNGIPYEIKWNDTGNVCEIWTIEELSQLAMEMDAYVTPLVTQQQEYEKAVLDEKSYAKIQNMKFTLEVVSNEV